MAIKVYKLEDGNYALVDSTEAEKIKTIDDLKSQNVLLSIVGAALAIPAAIVTSGALAAVLTVSGIYVTAKTMVNNETIRQLEGKDIDFMYLLNQGLAVPGVLLPGASMAARGLQKSSSVVQTLDGLGTGYSLAISPASIGLSVPDLYKDRQQYYIDRGEDLNYEKWKASLQFRIFNDWRGPESYRGDALKIFGERMTSENSAGDDIPTTATPSDVTTTNTVAPSFSVADSLYDFNGNSILPGWLASPYGTNSLDQSLDSMNKIFWPRKVEPQDNIILKIGDWTYQTERVTYKDE